MAEEFACVYDELDESAGGRLLLELTAPLCLWDRDLVRMMGERGQLAVGCQLLRREGVVFDTEGRLLACNALHAYPLGRYGTDFSTAAELRRHLGGEAVASAYDTLTSLPSGRCAECGLSADCGGACVTRWVRHSYEDYRPYLRW